MFSTGIIIILFSLILIIFTLELLLFMLYFVQPEFLSLYLSLAYKVLLLPSFFLFKEFLYKWDFFFSFDDKFDFFFFKIRNNHTKMVKMVNYGRLRNLAMSKFGSQFFLFITHYLLSLCHTKVRMQLVIITKFTQCTE